MADKKNFMLRLDDQMYKALEKWAADEFRSVNGQIEYLLHRALQENKRWSAEKKSADKK
ncbi:MULTISPECIES: Arc family DNA binding domain-containing protein [unclassified Sphingobacterium]|uniref:ribbon-helix-helix domain-containing protein n=1 Tax=unclassified Sphingobacterium TaxID=2609468 RepID=UPI000CEA0A56|nr:MULTISPECIES: Arc family DNA binding domain-containing protein [unclassified Sphingobacterium]QIH33173.1 Arc family DNA binding domain-containing protein [Sphingobacterium sp. DR205]